MTVNFNLLIMLMPFRIISEVGAYEKSTSAFCAISNKNCSSCFFTFIKIVFTLFFSLSLSEEFRQNMYNYRFLLCVFTSIVVLVTSSKCCSKANALLKSLDVGVHKIFKALSEFSVLARYNVIKFKHTSFFFPSFFLNELHSFYLLIDG